MPPPRRHSDSYNFYFYFYFYISPLKYHHILELWCVYTVYLYLVSKFVNKKLININILDTPNMTLHTKHRDSFLKNLNVVKQQLITYYIIKQNTLQEILVYYYTTTAHSHQEQSMIRTCYPHAQ